MTMDAHEPILTHDQASAIADGEASPELVEALVRRAAGDPAAAEAIVKAVASQARLRGAVSRVMRDTASEPAGDIRSTIEHAHPARSVAAGVAGDFPDQSSDGETMQERGVIGVIGRWLPAAAAAVLLLASLVSLSLVRQHQPGPDAGLLPATTVARLTDRHVNCTRMLESLYRADEMPKQVAALPGVLQARFGDAPTDLDLEALGYRFDRMGDCNIPSGEALHLIYQAAEGTGRADALSLWITPADALGPFEARELYTVADEHQPHPILVWSDGRLTYYLVGDSMPRIQSVSASLRERS